MLVQKAPALTVAVAGAFAVYEAMARTMHPRRPSDWGEYGEYKKWRRQQHQAANKRPQEKRDRAALKKMLLDFLNGGGF